MPCRCCCPEPCVSEPTSTDTQQLAVIHRDQAVSLVSTRFLAGECVLLEDGAQYLSALRSSFRWSSALRPMRGRLVIPAVRGRCWQQWIVSCDRLRFRVTVFRLSRARNPFQGRSGRRAHGDVRPGSFSRTVIAGGVVELRWNSRSAETETPASIIQ